MEKVKLTAKQAQEGIKTDGKKWLENQIFKNIGKQQSTAKQASFGILNIVCCLLLLKYRKNFEISDMI